MSDMPERVRRALSDTAINTIRADAPLMREAFKDSPEILAQIDAVMAGFDEIDAALAELDEEES